MSEKGGRMFGGLAALAVLWIIVYWAWEPSRVVVSYDRPEDDLAPLTSGAIVDPVRQMRREQLSGAGQTGAPLPGSAAKPPVAPPPVGHVVQDPEPEPSRPIAVIPPQFRDYTIRAGDTLEGIARRELGSARHVEAIRAANPLMSPDRLPIGRVIRLPLDPTNIQGKPNPELASEPQTVPAAPEREPAEYIVKSGDTLSGIARAIYGSTRYDDFLYQANRDRLASKDDLRIGQKLRIPEKPKE